MEKLKDNFLRFLNEPMFFLERKQKKESVVQVTKITELDQKIIELDEKIKKLNRGIRKENIKVNLRVDDLQKSICVSGMHEQRRATYHTLNYMLTKKYNQKEIEHVKWERAANEAKEVRTKYWRYLYQRNMIALADDLKCISSTYLSYNSKDFYHTDNIKDIFSASLCKGSKIAFDEYVKDKSIRLRGPTTKSNPLPLENKKQLTITLNAYKLDEHADISYYSSANFDSLRERIILLLQEGVINFAVINRSSVHNLELPEDIKDKVIPMHMLHLERNVFDAGLMGVQRVVYDLIRRGVRKIEIEGVNLYSQLPYHNKDYKYVVTSIGSKLFDAWAMHDIVFNFSFLKGSMNYVDTDVKIIDEYSFLLELSKEEYIKILVDNIKKELEGVK